MYAIALIIIILVLCYYVNTNLEYFSNFTTINYSQLFRRNRDLDYASKRFGFTISHLENIHTNQIAPISPILELQNKGTNTLWGAAELPDDYSAVTNRVSDRFSNDKYYIHKVW
jgi:hypothetical protein